MDVLIDKISLTATVNATAKLSEVKRRFNREGLYFGYHAMREGEATVAEHLSEAIPNLYHFKFGSLADLVATASIALDSGASFRLPQAPRSAIGPDFVKFAIGSRGKAGCVTDVTLRLSPVPERIRCALINVPSEDAAKACVAAMVGDSVRPLFFRHFDFENAPRLPGKAQKLVSDSLAFCLAGTDAMARAEEDVLEEYCERRDHPLRWLELTESQEFMSRFLFKNENYAVILEQYRDFLWTPHDASEQESLEKKFFES